MDAADCARTSMDVIGSLSSATGIPATKHLTFLKDCIYTNYIEVYIEEFER
jgi:hypothetical protein